MDEKVIGILAAAAGVAPTLAAELATTDEGIAELQTKVTAKLADVKKNASARGLKIATDALVAAGAEATVFEDGREFKDNVAAAVEAIKGTAAATSANTLTDEQVLKLPAVVQLKNELLLDTDRKVKVAQTEAAEALKKDREAFQKDQILVGVRSWAEKQVDEELKPNFSTEPKIAANQRKDLIDKIVAAGTYRPEGAGYVLVDGQGEIIKDAMQNVLKPEARAREIAESFYGLPVSTPKDSPSPKQADVAGGNANGYQFKAFKGTPPKNDNDFETLANDPNLSTAALKELQEYRAAQPKE